MASLGRTILGSQPAGLEFGGAHIAPADAVTVAVDAPGRTVDIGAGGVAEHRANRDRVDGGGYRRPRHLHRAGVEAVGGVTADIVGTQTAGTLSGVATAGDEAAIPEARREHAD